MITAFPVFTKAQIGGKGIYMFMNLPQSARATAVGGNIGATFDNDINAAYQNPSIINPSMDRHAAVNYLAYFDGVNAGYFSYGRKIDERQGYTAGLLYYNYGSFTRTDEVGNVGGNFGASDYLLHYSYGRQLGNKYYGGATVKTIYSQYDTYNSLAFAFDVAASYVDTANYFISSLIVKNVGFPVMNYIQGEPEPLPFEVQLTVSKKLNHAPFRFFLTAHNLQKPDLSYSVPDIRFKKIDLQTGEPIEDKIGLGDKIMRHVILGTELVFSKNFNVRFGLNYQRRMEMSLPDYRGFAGFAWGFSLRLLKTNISYANGGFFPGKGTHQISLLLNLNELRKQQNL